MASPIELLASGSVVNADSIIITDLSLEFIKYQIEISALIPTGATDTNLAMRTSTDNGVSFYSGAGYSYDIARSSQTSGTTLHFPGTTFTFLILINGLTTVTANLNSMVVEVFNAMSTTGLTTTLTSATGKPNSTGSTSLEVADTLSYRNAAEANNALQILSITNSGTLSQFSMKYSLYGYRP